MLALLNWNLHAALRLALLDKLDVILLDKLFLTAVLFKLSDLLSLRLVVGDVLLVLLHLVGAVFKENALFLKFLPELLKLLSVFVLT